MDGPARGHCCARGARGSGGSRLRQREQNCLKRSVPKSRAPKSCSVRAHRAHDPMADAPAVAEDTARCHVPENVWAPGKERINVFSSRRANLEGALGSKKKKEKLEGGWERAQR